MASPRRIMIFTAELTMLFLVVCSVTAHLEQTKAVAGMPRLALGLHASKTTATTTRLLRSGDTDGDVNNEDRGKFGDQLILPFMKLDLKLSLNLNHSPYQILNQYRTFGVLLEEKYLLLWMRYVQKYRAQVGEAHANDAYVIQTLQSFISKEKLSHLLTAMNEYPKLRSLGENLQKLVGN
ncbi:RxLR effector protein [Phytophthora megakarya]|uniref:RxLR effector protein n=1 Tax=Phytophthora megakarya TaxID=4795 RepID=A0A225WW65_9STRA|nr:RxLR effector protein [Phytophthora megakarya]